MSSLLSSDVLHVLKPLISGTQLLTIVNPCDTFNEMNKSTPQLQGGVFESTSIELTEVDLTKIIKLDEQWKFERKDEYGYIIDLNTIYRMTRNFYTNMLSVFSEYLPRYNDYSLKLFFKEVFGIITHSNIMILNKLLLPFDSNCMMSDIMVLI
jgi:hypothetical protein